MKNLIFMGTQSFALEILKSLYEKTKESACITVVTQPDKPSGRGYKLKTDCVKQFALDNSLDVLQPATLKSEEFYSLLKEISPEMIAVASYGKILPENVIDFPPLGCVNVHGSLLPEYRGAAPINRVIMDGKKTTGVTLMYMDKGLDTGDMIAKREIEIGDMNAGELREALASLGAELLGEWLDRLLVKKIRAEKQDDAYSSYAAKITQEDRPIDFSLGAEEILCRIRGLAPDPGATAGVEGRYTMKVLEAALCEAPDDSLEPGELFVPAGMKKNTLAVKCGKGALILKTLQPDGSKAMDAASLLNGRKIAFTDRLK
ncbi:MAG: methionyl-tRNA formyltransferase [Clostridia bacterium]|nr:methionyl-tRNA formyltransferase [Clostridia bacterium]